MKVLQINTQSSTSCIGRITVCLYQVLDKHGHDCLIAYGRGNPPEDADTLKIGSVFDVYAHVLKARLLDSAGFGSVWATRKLVEQIKEYDPDIIHLHSLHGYYINIEVLFRYLAEAQKAVVWTFHDEWSFTGHCPCFSFIGCCKWKTGCGHCPRVHEHPASILLDRSRRNYRKKKELFNLVDNLTIITPSQWMAGLVKQSFLARYPVRVIHNGIDLSVFKPISGNFRYENHLENKFVILGVSNLWDPTKGMKTFVELSERLGKEFQIVLVGLSQEQKKHLSQNIIGIMHTDNVQELAEIYTAADAFVNPTLEDNFPTTNLEALACGTPVITFNTGGSPESIDKTCGIVVEKGNVDALEAALRTLKRKNFSQEACLARAREFDMNKRFEDYLDLYQTKKQT